MISLSADAKQKYAGFTSSLARDISQGNDSALLELVNTIHDKYKAVQAYPCIGKEVSNGVRKIPLALGWSMLYRPAQNCIEVIDFVKEGSI